MGQAHFLPTTPDFNICPKFPGGKGPPLGCSGGGKRITAHPLRTLLFLFSPRPYFLLFQSSMFQVLKINVILYNSSEFKINLTNLLEDSLGSSETP